MKRPTQVALALVGLVALAGGWLWLPSAPDDDKDRTTRGPVSIPQAESSSTPTPTPTRRPECPATAQQPFRPVSINVAGVPGRIGVLAPPRDANGVPGVPPLSSGGKNVFAWDREQGIEPGEDRGNVLLNAHTWPDGTALGNDLLRTLDRGDRIVVRGKSSRLCYRVTEKVEVAAERGLPKYYATKGRPQLAIVVCSGRRLGPGAWENRTVWFASPTA